MPLVACPVYTSIPYSQELKYLSAFRKIFAMIKWDLVLATENWYGKEEKSIES